jgi:hypothetical protein
VLPPPGHLAITNPAARRPLRRLAAPAIAGGAVLVLLAGCGSGSPKAAGGNQQLTAGQAIGLAASQARHVNSYALSVHTRSTGFAAANTSGTMQIRLKPSLLGKIRMNLSLAGHAVPVEEILTPHAVYLKLSSLGDVTGKPWIKLSDSGLKHGAGATIGQLLQGIENADPLTQTSMLTASKDMRKVGTQVINGVPTTHYAGSYAIAAALAKVPASMRSLTRPVLKSMGITRVHFNAWIDAQHQLRKMVTTEAGRGSRITTTVVITAINQPVSVSLPPASQVAAAPSGLG